MEQIRFTVDGMLGKLAKYLRALGFDTLYEPAPGKLLMERSEREGRVFVTLRKSLPEKSTCPLITLQPGSVEAQLRRIFESSPVRPVRDNVLTRCIECNVVAEDAELESIKSVVPEKIKKQVTTYRRCPSCGKVYWWGSHADRILRILERSGVFDLKK